MTAEMSNLYIYNFNIELSPSCKCAGKLFVQKNSKPNFINSTYDESAIGHSQNKGLESDVLGILSVID